MSSFVNFVGQFDACELDLKEEKDRNETLV